MKICEKCGRPISYNSYFKAYFCTQCGGYYSKGIETNGRTITVKRNDKAKIVESQKVVCNF